MRNKSLWIALAGLGVGVFVACSPDPPIVSVNDVYVPYGSANSNPYSGIHDRAAKWRSEYGRLHTPTGPLTASNDKRQPMIRETKNIEVRKRRGPSQSASSLLREVSLKRDYLSTRARGRSRKPMKPRYITIHSTQNWSKGADARRHALALKRGALGRISWHYTVDENLAVQHLPCSEQGNHADHHGPGNRLSIGIEMCEHPGNSRRDTMNRTAKLAAWLMYRYDIPISNVVPHYKWPRWGKKPPNKNCPHFLMTNGRPGSKWYAFRRKVDSYYKKISSR